MKGVQRGLKVKDLVLLLLLYSRTGPRRAVSLKLSDTRVYEPEKRTRLGRNREMCTLSHVHVRMVSTTSSQSCEAVPRRDRIQGS